jgi:micrococcal nuclease
MRRVPVVGTVAFVVLVAATLAMLVLGWQLVTDRGVFGSSTGTVDGTGATAAPDPDEPPIRRPPGVTPDARPARVVHVVDGDTVHVVPIDAPVDVPSRQRDRVRLLNIDTPELGHPERGRECGAGTATRTLADLLDPPAVVWLATDVEDRDRFDRSLRYLWSEDGVDVQRTLVDTGLAEVIVVGRNHRFADPLFERQRVARDGAVGIWGPGCLD